MTEEQLNIFTELFNEAKYEELIAEVERNEKLEVDNLFLPQLALSYFHTEKYAKSTSLFEQVCANTKEPVSWFNLCTSAIMNNNERRGLEALDTAIRNNRETKTDGKGMPTAFMILYATNALIDTGKYNLAFNQLNELAEIYGSISITDSHFLYSRGIPSFGEFLKLSEDILPKQTVTSTVKDWVDYVSSRLDDEGKASLQEIGANLKA